MNLQNTCNASFNNRYETRGINGVRKGLAACNNEINPGYENCANTAPLVLKTGDNVNKRTTNGNFLYMEWSSFKGWKVK